MAAVSPRTLLPIEIGIIKGREATSCKSIKTGVVNADSAWQDSDAVIDQA